MTFPWLLLALSTATLAALAGQWTLAGRPKHDASEDTSETPDDEQAASKVSHRGLLQFGAIVAAVAVYTMFAETVGFVLLGGAILCGLLLVLGTRPAVSLAVAAVFTPAVYHLFAVALRVPLPRGWWGW